MKHRITNLNFTFESKNEVLEFIHDSTNPACKIYKSGIEIGKIYRDYHYDWECIWNIEYTSDIYIRILISASTLMDLIYR